MWRELVALTFLVLLLCAAMVASKRWTDAGVPRLVGNPRIAIGI